MLNGIVFLLTLSIIYIIGLELSYDFRKINAAANCNEVKLNEVDGTGRFNVDVTNKLIAVNNFCCVV